MNNMNQQLRHPGSDGHALHRHRRQGLLRLQRFCARLRPGADTTLRPTTPSASTRPIRRATANIASSPSRSTGPGIKLEYRPGYYAPADFKHSGKEDREQELEDQLASDLPATDIAVYMDAMYFRLDANRYYMPVSLVVPGSQIPFVKGGDKDKATLDIIGAVIDDTKRPVGRVARHRQAQSRRIARRRGRKISSTPPASTCRRANISSNLWCAKTKPAAWARSSPMSRCPISKKPRSK